MKLQNDIVTTPPALAAERARAKRQAFEAEVRSASSDRTVERARARGGVSVATAAGGHSVLVVRRSDANDFGVGSAELDQILGEWAGDLIDDSLDDDDDSTLSADDSVDGGARNAGAPALLRPRRELRSGGNASSQNRSEPDRERKRRPRDERENEHDGDPVAMPAPSIAQTEAQAHVQWDTTWWDDSPSLRVATALNPNAPKVQRIAPVLSPRRSPTDTQSGAARNASSAMMWAVTAIVVVLAVTLLAAIFMEPAKPQPAQDEEEARAAQRMRR